MGAFDAVIFLNYVVCDQETSKTRSLKSATGLWKYNHSGL